MKICPNCHNTFPDTGSFCNACGTPLVPAVQNAPAAPAPAEQKESKFSIILRFLFRVFAILSATLSGCAMGVASNQLLYKGGGQYDVKNYYHDIVANIRCSFCPDETCATIAVVLAAIALAVALGILIYTLIKRRNYKAIFSAITYFLAGGGLLAVTIAVAG